MFATKENWEVRGIYKSSQNIKKLKKQSEKRNCRQNEKDDKRRYLQKRTVTAIKDKMK